MDDLKSSPQVEPPSFRKKPPPPHARGGLSRRYVIGVALALAAVGAVIWWVESRPAPQPPRGRFATTGAMPVAVATAAKGDIDIVFNALGTVTPLATVTVKTQINGQITRIDFKEGQHVNKGDLLAEIDNRPYLFALDQAQGQLLRDQAILKAAENDLARYRVLAKQDSIARQQVDTQEQLVRQYQGVVKADQAQVDNARLNLTYCSIVAPIGGRVGLRQIDEGNYAQVSDPNGIVVITQTQPISVMFSLPEDNLQTVLRRLHDGATLAVTAFDRSGTKQLATGTLATVDNQINTATGTIRARADFPNGDESLFPNQFVNVKLLADTLHDATVIPNAAVQRGEPGTFVYVVGADDTVSVRPVKLGPSQGERVAVTSGLQPGERVVVDGADKLRDKAKVDIRVVDGTQQPAAAPESAPQRRRSRNP